MLQRNRLAVMTAGTALLLWVVPPALAQTAGMLSFQGLLRDSTGRPVTGNVEMTFSIYDAQNGGTLKAGPFTPSLRPTAANGLVSTKFGPISAGTFDGGSRWLEVSIKGPTDTQFTKLTRTEIATAAATAEQLNRPGTGTSAIAIDSNGNVGIGSAAPKQRVIAGDTRETINRMPAVDEAVVIGTQHYAAGTKTGLMFDMDSKRLGGILLEKINNAGNEDSRMRFYVTRDGNPNANECLTINEAGSIGIGTPTPKQRLVVGDTRETINRMPAVDEGIVIGTQRYAPGTTTGLMFDIDSKRLGGILFEKTNDAGNEDSRMHFYVTRDGYPQAKQCMTLYETGMVSAPILRITGGSDLAEPFSVAKPKEDAEKIEPGMVVVIDPDKPGQLKLAREPYDRKVAGVISGANGLQPGMVMTATGSPATRPAGESPASADHPVALTGRVYVWADASFGAIQPGDMLTTSATPGHAMKAADRDQSFGAVIGKAMMPLKSGKGLILVLVGLQ